MKSTNASGCLKFLTTELFPIAISLIALILSSFNLYIDYLKAPDISFVVAPSISHLVDDQSQNEAFFIPITVINRGARPGTVMSLELAVTNLTTQGQADYFAQYYVMQDNASVIGDLFSPIALQGYSSDSHTICFYPFGSRVGNFFAEPGVYEFNVIAIIANVQNEFQKSLSNKFRITLNEDMVAIMQGQPDGEYPYPLRIEVSE